MQARRISSPEAKVALNDAMSRVSSIAIVHETLSQAFDEIVEFDRVADGLLRMIGDVAASWGGVSAVRQGSFGLLSADVATSLAMIITELCQNAVEHGLAAQSGEVRVAPSIHDGRLRVEISDDGRGLPPGRPATNGIRGMRERAMLIGAKLAISPRSERGTEVKLTIPLDRTET
jgi:two-component sensor histidine kinase